MTRSLHTPDYAALIRLVVEARKESGLTQQDVAAKLGKPQSYVAKVEGGERRLDVVEFIALARAIGAKPSALFDRLVETLDSASA
ncbi:MAG: XRE family transcriptional regulator [Hyphomicrobiales bacterium]|nr:MAG: XRE family transcriptional regulator [Hyphomicrobiales bacterium]